MKLTTLAQKICIAMAFAGAAAAANAAYPEKTIKLVVPFPPGGAGDTIARIVTARMSEILKQPVILDFKPGAATILGADSVKNAQPDGYTLLLGTATTFVVNPLIYKKLPYNANTQFDPIGIVGSSALAMLANSKVPVTNVKEAVALAKSKPGAQSYGSHGSGSTVHFVGEMLWSASGSKVVHIPYKGSAPAMTDLMGGQIPFAFDSVPAAAAAAKGGKVKILATTGTTRAGLLPDVPTIAESGYPNVSLEAWWAIVAPKGIPKEAGAVLTKALADTMADPQVKGRLFAAGFDAKYGAPARYAELIKSDTAKLAPIAKDNNIQQD